MLKISSLNPTLSLTLSLAPTLTLTVTHTRLVLKILVSYSAYGLVVSLLAR